MKDLTARLIHLWYDGSLTRREVVSMLQQLDRRNREMAVAYIVEWATELEDDWLAAEGCNAMYGKDEEWYVAQEKRHQATELSGIVLEIQRDEQWHVAQEKRYQPIELSGSLLDTPSSRETNFQRVRRLPVVCVRR